MNNIEIIKAKMLELLRLGCVRSIVNKPERDSEAYIEKLKKNNDGTYYWEDIDYSDKSLSQWKTSRHLARISEILCQDAPERLENDENYRKTILGAFGFWLKNDFDNPNWWHNQIGTPINVGDITLLLEPYLSENERSKAEEIISRGAVNKNEFVSSWKGANLIWGMQSSIRYAVLTEDEKLVGVIYENICNELVPDTSGGFERDGGIQSDGAFHQHGCRWYSMGYGASFTFDMAQFVYLLHGTAFVLPQERINALLTHILDGQRKMTHKGVSDYNSLGREFTRKDKMRAAEVAFGLKLLKKCDFLPRRDEVEAFYDELVNEKAGENGTVYYPSISYISHKYDGIYYGVKCLGGKQLDAEACNHEGELCLNMSYGTKTCAMSNGREYFNLAPVMDYALIPGTVAEYADDAALLKHGDWSNNTLPNDLTFGISKNNIGVLSEYVEHDGISALVTYFTVEDCLIALGTDVTFPQGTKVNVTIDQCFEASPEVFVYNLSAANGDFLYTSLNDYHITVSCGEVTGSWKRNNTEQPDTPVNARIFKAYIPLSTQYDKYAYCISGREKTHQIRVIANSSFVQAVEYVCKDGQKLVLACFRKSFDLRCGGSVISGSAGEIKLQKV